MTQATFLPGQRWISDTESELGLGSVREVSGRLVTLLFPASGEQRSYRIDAAPLTRVKFNPGDRVESRAGWSIVVHRIEERDGLFTYQGRREDGQNATLEESGLSNLIRFSRPQDRLFSGQIDDPHWFDLRRETLERRGALEQSPVRGLCGTRMELLPHQLYIAHEVSRRPAPRVLLADEVGLGKTIEAGLILHRLLVTGRAERALILVPAALLHQWLVELLRKFNLKFSLFDEERLQALAEEDARANPFHTEQLVLTSLDLFRGRAARQRQLFEGKWDLLIVDEAHHLTWSEQEAGEEYLVVERLAHATRSVLLLTATPEQLGRSGHFARLRLLDPDRFHSLAAFREEERHYEPVAEAVQHLLAGDPLPQAATIKLLAALGEAESAPLLERLENPEATPEEQAAARRTLIERLLDRHGTGRVLFRNTRHGVQGFPQRVVHRYAQPLPQPYRALPAGNPQARLTPEHLVPAQGDEPWWRFDSRVEWLIGFLKARPRDKILMICAHAATAIELAEGLRRREGIHASLFHEGMTILERDRAAAWFADFEQGSRLMICSEIGSEGRNFQFAHDLILFDPPADPDLLEQRIGRLDRIGQKETVQIHIPWFDEGPQQVMWAWYHEGLDAFRHTCTACHTIFSQLRPALTEALDGEGNRDEDETLPCLIDSAQKLRTDLGERLRKGRDHLLELNSCRPAVAEALRERIRAQDSDSSLEQYMERMLDAYGVDIEHHSAQSLILHPGPRMQADAMPGLPEDGVTVTWDRATALHNEERQFLTAEHPMVQGAMDLLLGSGKGNSVAIAIKDPAIKTGTLLLEALYLVECVAPRGLQAGRFLPPTLVRLVVDQTLGERTDEFPTERIDAIKTRLDPGVARRIVAPLQTRIRAMLEQADELAQERYPDLVERAMDRMVSDYEKELERLAALRKVNPNVRTEEIEILHREAETLADFLAVARPRLDAVRLIVGV